MRGLTHDEVARWLGYSEGSGMISRLISGERRMSLEGAFTLEARLGIPMSHWAVPAKGLAATGTDG